MYIFLLIIHVIVCLVLIAVVLLQAGRGGGFSDMLGGAQPQSIFGTQTNAFMTRATEVCAVLFIVTSLSLGVLSVQRGKSLIDSRSFQRQKAAMPAGASAETAARPTETSASTKVAPGANAEKPAAAAEAVAVPAAPADAAKS